MPVSRTSPGARSIRASGTYVRHPGSSVGSHASFNAALGRSTPLAPRDAAQHLARAWQEVFGEPAPSGGLASVWAQWALETGRGRWMYGNNFGGLKGRSPHGTSAVESTREGFGRSERRTRARFRTYRTVEEGARDYLRTLARDYPRAWAQARAGNPEAFAEALERAHYFSGDPRVYQRSIVSLAREFDASPKRAEANAPFEPSLAVTARRVSPAVFGVLRALTDGIFRHPA